MKKLKISVIVFLGILILFSGCINQTSNVKQPINVSNVNVQPVNLEIGASTRILNYTLNGYNGQIQVTVYKGVNNWLAKQPRSVIQGYNFLPIKNNYNVNLIGYKEQDKFLNKLVYKIQNIAPDRNNQARIAISLVQNIPYDNNIKSRVFTERYPYQVIYDNKGIARSKSELLIYLLKNLGFGTAIFDFPMGSTDINHLVVGIKVLSKYAYENTHYAFIETDKPNIITFSNLTYLSKDGSRGRLNHIPNVIVMSDGYTFNASMDYTDAKLMNTVWHKRLNISQVKEVNRLVKKYGLTYRLIHSKSKIKTNIIYNGTGILPDHTFYYIKIPTNISKIRVLVNASKPISVYVLSGNWSEIIKTYENHQIPMGSLVKNCKSNDFKNHVDFTCILWNPYTVSGEYSLLGVLIDNQGMGNNTINMLFKK